MQPTDENLQTLSFFLSQTVSNDVQNRKKATEELEKVSTQQGFPILLLMLIQNQAVAPAVKQSAAVYFKNFAKQRWTPQSDEFAPVHYADKDQIKSNLIDLMLSQPKNIQKPLSSALQIISSHDFPHNWQSLIPTMVERLNTTDFGAITSVMQALNSVFKAYRSRMPSDRLMIELKHVLDAFAAPFTAIFVQCCQQIPQNLGNAGALVSLFSAIKTMLAIFYSLNCVDIPEYFEDNREPWFTNFHNLLSFQSQIPELVENPNDETAPGLLTKVQCGVLSALNLYMNKYEDLVQETNMLNTFATDTWALLTRVGLEPQYDSVATMGMMFLATIAKGVLHNLFEGDGILDSVCKNIVVPNVRCREIDQETFEDDPLAYVRGDIEGNDVETRRRGASELVKALRKHYEKQVTECLSGYIGHLLNQYNSNPQANWRDKDSVIYLIIALSVVGSTKEKGATAVNTLVPLENFYKTNIVPELTTNGVSPIIAASALKFVVSFRTMLPVADIPALMSAFVKLAGSNSVVVQSYASICIERFLLLRREDGTPRVAPEVIRSLLSEAFTTLFTALNGSMKENPYVMRAIMRLVATAKLEIAPVAQTALMSICNKLSEIYRNPSNPHFTHYLFETMAGIIGVLIKTENYADIEAAEKILMPAFNVIVDEDHVDLAPYMFQIVSQLVEAHKSSAESLVQRYGGLYKKFLAPQWWLRHGNVPALARLIRAFIVFAPQYVVQEDIKPVLGIFQKLVASKTLDKFGIQILVEIVRHIPQQVWDPLMVTVLGILFTRLQSSRTIEYIGYLLEFFSVFMVKFSVEVFVQYCDRIAQGVWNNLFSQVWVNSANKVPGSSERKAIGIGSMVLLAQFAPLQQDPQAWGSLLELAVKLFIDSEEASHYNEFEEDTLGLEEAGGFSSSFAQLVYTGVNDEDFFPEYDSHIFLGQRVAELFQTHGQLMNAAPLSDRTKAILQELMNKART